MDQASFGRRGRLASPVRPPTHIEVEAVEIPTSSNPAWLYAKVVGVVIALMFVVLLGANLLSWYWPQTVCAESDANAQFKFSGCITMSKAQAAAMQDRISTVAEGFKSDAADSVSLYDSPCRPTLAQFKRLRLGMSQSSVESSLGCGGQETARMTAFGKESVSFAWDGNGDGLSVVHVRLTGGGLASMSQTGLQ